MKNNRSRFEIMGDILKLSTFGTKKTHIMYQANLSYEQLIRYLEELEEKSLLKQRVEEGDMVFLTTEKGREFLLHLSGLSELMTERPEAPAARYMPSRTR